MRSRFGVGITPPKVLVTPKPASSVMMSSTFGAPLGGTTRAGQYGFDCAAFFSILPPNFCAGGGSCCPGIDVVAPGDPGASAALVVPPHSAALPGGPRRHHNRNGKFDRFHWRAR